MKRKVIQIANSTQLVSLPRKWSQKYGIKKGAEIEVEENGNKIVISTERGFDVEKVELDVSELRIMTQRCVHALYKKGANEIKLTFNHPELIESVQNALGKEAVGFEITEQGPNYCVIKHVSGELQEFDSVLRRAFLILLSMADSSLEAIKKRDFSALKSISLLEEANNRFTTSCRRFINKIGYQDPRKTGPLYYIVEDMENVADEYKYLCDYLYNLKNKKVIIGKDIIEIYKKTNEMLKTFYELFYKFDKNKLELIGESRREIVKNAYNLFEKSRNPTDRIILHHMLVIIQKIFCFLGPYLVMNL
ncbi:phosphate uptake regulator PhoU [Candidatus Woesearchaeota archaeon]|nr:phosphate uptake regulator PhoU [Candidatus Woesearchaeota archaeon]